MTIDLATASDGELANLALAGRQAAYGEIMRRHRESLLRLIRAHIGGDDEAIDVLQDCFIAAFAKLHQFDRFRPMRAWLARIAINKARDWRRRRVVRQFFLMALPLTSDIAETVADGRPGMDAALNDRAALARTLATIASLPTSLKEPLILSALDGWPQSSIADLLGISEKAVETRISRARARLRALLAALDGKGG
ncbi:MAG: RNA polymerase sigma factor [Sphingomonas sp.]|uniref:RNA polymerase sigma factor n=1 Tax=Sphingomonas sp. TaxID=28214 RepID=UPI003565430C